MEPYTAGEVKSESAAKHLKDRIKESEALLAIVTREGQESAWVQNEIGIAWASHGCVYAIVDKNLKLKGILPFITTYLKFDPISKENLKENLVEIGQDIMSKREPPATFSIIGYPTFQGPEGQHIPPVLTRTKDFVSRIGIQFNIRLIQPPIVEGDVVVEVYIPPEFKPRFGTDNRSIEILSEYKDTSFSIERAVGQDLCPGWWKIVFDLPAKESGKNKWFSFRLKDVVTPMIAGSYPFTVRTLHLMDGSSKVLSTSRMPGLVVKGEVDPGKMTGKVLHSSSGLPLMRPGKIHLKGVANDPYTGVCTGRFVEAIGYFGADSRSRYSVEGVPAGAYDIVVEAYGYPAQVSMKSLKVEKGQSLDVDLNVQESSEAI